ncbi:MAG: tetratricopeptide repeat protein [Gemmatimonadota bacterium]
MDRMRRQGWFVAVVLSAVVLSALVPGTLTAQARQMAAKRFMVTNLRSAERNLGQQAADAIRNSLEGEFPPRVVQVMSKQDINSTLEQSGYSTTEALSSADAKALANLIRADEYLEGTVSKTATGFRVEAKLVLARDNNVVEPLAIVDGARLNEIGDKVAREVREARRQVDDEAECYLAARQSKYADAIRRSRDVIKRLPKANMMRLCLLTTLQSMKQPTDSLLPVIDEILKTDSLNRVALTAASAAYKEKGDSTRYIRTLVTLVAGDPTNVTLLNRVVSDLGAYRRADVAAPIIRQAVQENPGDVNLTTTAWKVAFAAGNWKEAIGYGEEMVKLDTAAADTTFFTRLGVAFVNDSQPAKAAEAFARGTAKFPQNVALWLALGAQQRKAGQVQQSIESIRKALAIDPKAENAHLLIAQAFTEMQQPDSALSEVRVALTAGVDKAVLGPYSLSLANGAYRAANASKAREDWMRALKVAQFADSVAGAPAAKFLAGTAAFNIAIPALQEAGPAKNCDVARLSRDHFAIAEQMLPLGGSTSPQAAGQMLQFVNQYGPNATKMVELLCKAAAPVPKTPPKKPGAR